MTADELNDTQRRLLAALACYRLLNVQQMLRLGVAGSEASIRLEARVLERKKLIGANDWHLVPSVRTLPRLHWLTDRGAEILATGGEDDPLGARREMGSEGHIMHRIKTVDAHIALRLWAASAGVAVHWFVTDFEPGSGGLRKPPRSLSDSQKPSGGVAAAAWGSPFKAIGARSAPSVKFDAVRRRPLRVGERVFAEGKKGRARRASTVGDASLLSLIKSL